MSTPTLSILLPSIPERAEQFGVLMTELLRQTESYDVELLPYVTSRRAEGGPIIGAKRQKLIEDARGQWSVFVDDDDWIAPDYVRSIMEALEANPDAVGFLERVEGMGTGVMRSVWSNRYPKWMEGKEAAREGFDFVRTTFHKTPLRTSIALQVGFNTTMGFGEDHDFSKRLKHAGLVTSEVFIEKELYTYRFKYEKHTTKY